MVGKPLIAAIVAAIVVGVVLVSVNHKPARPRCPKLQSAGALAARETLNQPFFEPNNPYPLALGKLRIGTTADKVVELFGDSLRVRSNYATVKLPDTSPFSQLMMMFLDTSRPPKITNLAVLWSVEPKHFTEDAVKCLGPGYKTGGPNKDHLLWTKGKFEFELDPKSSFSIIGPSQLVIKPLKNERVNPDRDAPPLPTESHQREHKPHRLAP
jgi:hypothetical protein